MTQEIESQNVSQRKYLERRQEEEFGDGQMARVSVYWLYLFALLVILVYRGWVWLASSNQLIQAQCTVHCPQCTLHCVQCTVQSA